MPEILHHDAELTDLFRIGTGGEVFRRVRVRQRNYMKTHAETLAGFPSVGGYSSSGSGSSAISSGVISRVSLGLPST